MTTWHDISTAPKDGTVILGAAKDGDGWEQTTVKWYGDAGGYWSLTVCGAYAEDSEWWPTHWQLAPEPPCC